MSTIYYLVPIIRDNTDKECGSGDAALLRLEGAQEHPEQLLRPVRVQEEGQRAGLVAILLLGRGLLGWDGPSVSGARPLGRH